jgi:hypothetical protein
MPAAGIASSGAPESPVDLGSAGDFAILTKSGISTTGVTHITGDIGVSPIAATAITGFGLVMDASNQFSKSSLVTGNVYAASYASPTPAKMTAAVSDMEAAYTDAAGRTLPDHTELGGGNIGGMTLFPGLYKWSSGVTIPTDVTLSGGSDGVWIFQIDGTLVVSSATHVHLIGGAKARNVFWQVTGQVTLGTTSKFVGNILCATKIAFNSGATLDGRALAQTEVTLIANTISTPDGTGKWDIAGFKDSLTPYLHSLGIADAIDYDGSLSAPGAAYGDNIPTQSVIPYSANPQVTMSLFFDPNDPHLAGYAPVIGAPPMTYPFLADGTTAINGIAGTPFPPYAPYPDDTDYLNAADVYNSPYGTQTMEMLDSGRHTHVPEWQFNHWTPGDPAAAGKILPYDVMTFKASAFSDPVNDPDLIYFNKNYSAVKLWINIDPAMIEKAASLALAALDATADNDPWDYFDETFVPMDYLKLGRVSIIRTDTGEELASIGLVADPVTGNYWITQGSQLIMSGQVTDPNAPLPFQNPLARDVAPDIDIEIDKIALPGDDIDLFDTTMFDYASGTDTYSLGTDDAATAILSVTYDAGTILDPSHYHVDTSTSPDTIVLETGDVDFPVDLENGDEVTVKSTYPDRLYDTTSFDYDSGITDFDLGTDDEGAVITSVTYNGGTVLDPSHYHGNTGPSPDTITFETADVDFPVDLTTGDKITVESSYPDRAGIAEFATGTWYQIELSVDYLENTMFKAYDENGFLIVEDDIIDEIVPAQFDGDLTVCGIFGSPVADGSYITPVLPHALLRIDDVKPTYEEMESHESAIVDYLSNLVGTANYTADIPAANYGNRSVGINFTTTFPADMDALFDPWMSDYGVQMFEFADPVDTSNFIQVLLVPMPVMDIMPLQYLKDFGVTESEAMFLFLLFNGKKSIAGLPQPVHSRAIGQDVEIPIAETGITVQWNTTGGYNLTFAGLADPNPLDGDLSVIATEFSVTGESTFSASDRIGSGMISYIADAGYGITLNIMSMTVEVKHVPDAPVLYDLVLLSYDETGATIDVDWSSVIEADNYTVYYQNGGNPVKSVKGILLSDDFITVADGSGTYVFWVAAVNASGESALSNSKSIEILLELFPPEILGIDYHVADTLQSATVQVNWTVVSVADGYKVYQSTDNVTYTLVGSPTVATFSEVVTVTGTYYYKVLSFSGDIESLESDEEMIFVDLDYPGTPTIVISPDTSTSGIVHVDWVSVTRGNRYLVYMSTTPTVARDTAHLVANVSTTGVYYNVTAGNGTYYFVVVAVSFDKKQGLPSNTASVVVMIAHPPAPLSWFDQLIKWIQDLWGMIVAFFASLLALLLGTALIKNKRTPKDCVGGNCNI